MSVTTLPRPATAQSLAATLLPIMGVVFVAYGVEAVRRVPAHSRGLAMGAYTAFLDLAQGLASPALGLIAAGARLNVVFLVSAATVLCAALVASWLIAHPSNLEGSTQ
jgi:predicted MFS family arabinose efflux permease